MRVRLIAIGTLASLALSSAHIVFAQPTEATVEAPSALPGEEGISLRTGDTLEIAAETGVNGATYSWIMTQDRSFIDAKREKFFRYRFVNDNVYTLRAEAILPDTGERIQRTFRITVVPPDAQQQTPLVAAGTGASIASTIPLPDANGRVVLKPGESLVQLIPISADISPLALDFDASFDSDADGNPGNDVDNVNEDNGFHSFGKPLWIWYARPIQGTDITVTAIPEGQSPQVQRISVLSEDAAREQGVLTSPVSIEALSLEGPNFGFTAVFANPSIADSPLLYEWNFGDGNLSLETSPTHTYASSGTFDVTLSVRDLQTGNSIGSTRTSVSPTIEDTPVVDEPTEPAVDEPTEPAVDEPTEPAAEGSAIDWSRIGMIVALFLGALILGFALIWLLSFLRKSRKLEETLESMEKVVAPEKGLTPPPLAIKGKQQVPQETTVQQKIIDAEINASSSPAQPPASVNEAKAPDWLKKGLASDAVKPAAPLPKPMPAATPHTPPAPKSASATPSPKPTPEATSKASAPPLTPTPPTDTQNKNLPHWLQNPSPAPSNPIAPPVPAPPPAAPKPSAVPPPPSPAPTTPVAPIQKPAAQPAAPASTPNTAMPQRVPEAPKPFIPTPPSAPVAPKPTPSIPAPAQTPTAVTPPPVSPIAPAPQIQAMPSAPAAPPATPTDKKDDDPPIAFIRAENIGPGPTK